MPFNYRFVLVSIFPGLSTILQSLSSVMHLGITYDAEKYGNGLLVPWICVTAVVQQMMGVKVGSMASTKLRNFAHE